MPRYIMHNLNTANCVALLSNIDSLTVRTATMLVLLREELRSYQEGEVPIDMPFTCFMKID